MKCFIVDSHEYVYPDIENYQTAAASFTTKAVRGSYAACRLVIVGAEGELHIKVRGADCEIYEELAVPVESNPGFDGGFMPHFPERVAPFLVYDCEKPSNGTINVKYKVTSVYLRFPASESCRATIAVNSEINIPVEITACGKPLPETLQLLFNYAPLMHESAHGVKIGSEEFREIDRKYLQMMRATHQNRAYINAPLARKTEDSDWTFNFDFFIRRAKQLFDMGFEVLHIDGVGFRKAWDLPDIICNGMDALSYECYEYLSKYLTSLRKVLGENGWLDGRFTIGIAGEDNRFNATTYRALSGMVRRFIPELKIYDAVSFVEVYGAIDIWVPRIDEYERYKEHFDRFREDGDEMWHYVCLFPREGGYINRFMDIPLLATRYQFWGNYKYDLSGYLHWSVNVYQSGLDPFKGSCPDHINAGSKSILPPGDDKLIYPGDGEPWMSVRLEAHRESAEDYEMLCAVAQHNKALANEICEEVFHNFHDVEFDALKFRNVRNKLVEAYDRL